MSGQQPLEALEDKQSCQLKEAYPKFSYKDLIAKAKEKFNKTPSDSQLLVANLTASRQSQIGDFFGSCQRITSEEEEGIDLED
jgi:hypothetical protein